MDYRVVILWWVCITIAAMSSETPAPLLLLFAVLVLFWIWLRGVKAFLSSTLRLAPVLIFVGIIGLSDPLLGLTRSIRFYILLSSSALAISDQWRFTNAIRNLKPRRHQQIGIVVELVAQMLEQALMMIPLTLTEVSELQEVQRSKGIEEKGFIGRAKASLDLVVPLFGRIFARSSRIGMTSELLGFDPFAHRSIYEELTMSWCDKAIALMLILLTVIFVVLF